MICLKNNNCRAGSEANNPNAMLFGLGGCGVCMYVTLLRSKCTISYMQRTRGLTENTWHAQKKTFKRSEEMSHQELRLAHQDERYLSSFATCFVSDVCISYRQSRLAAMRERAEERRQQETEERRYTSR